MANSLIFNVDVSVTVIHELWDDGIDLFVFLCCFLIKFIKFYNLLLYSVPFDSCQSVQVIKNEHAKYVVKPFCDCDEFLTPCCSLSGIHTTYNRKHRCKKRFLRFFIQGTFFTFFFIFPAFFTLKTFIENTIWNHFRNNGNKLGLYDCFSLCPC